MSMPAEPPRRRRSAGMVIVRPAQDGPRYLLLRAYRYWDFPKGELEAGERPLEAALREVREETGLPAPELPWGEVWRETPPYAGGKVARYYLGRSRDGEVHLGVSPELGRPEHHEYRWLPYEAARPLLNERVAAILDWARARVEAGSR
jgi:bis(5'-nucleosidyl)-tetraphosphatase